MIRKVGIALTVFSCFLGSACKERRSPPEYDNESEDQEGQAAVKEGVGAEESKDPEGDEEVRRLAAEKEASDQKIAELQRILLEIETKMKDGNSLTDAEKIAYQQQLDQIKKDKEAAEAKRIALEEEAKKAEAARKRFSIYYDKPEAGVRDDCLMFEGDLMADGALLRVRPCDFGLGQQFFLTYVNETDFRLTSRQSNKCIGVVDNSKLPDTALVQQVCGNMPGQIFRLMEKAPSLFNLQNLNSLLCMKILADGRIRQNNCQTTSSPFRLAVSEGA